MTGTQMMEAAGFVSLPSGYTSREFWLREEDGVAVTIKRCKDGHHAAGIGYWGQTDYISAPDARAIAEHLGELDGRGE